MAECNFATLTPTELRVYFTLTRRVETPQFAAEFQRAVFEPQMVRIPPGKFLMGYTPEQAGQAIEDGEDPNEAAWEQPQHEVELSEYFIGKYPVTNREYQVYIQETHEKPPGNWDGENYSPGEGDHPAERISWNDAQAYCSWLSLKTGKPYRLPTEAEWEKAARGQDGRVYPWGNDFDPKKCNTVESRTHGTTPVGQFSQAGGDSPYGCTDMSGNVLEWCHDWFYNDEYLTRSRKAVKDPVGPKKGTLRILRSGAYGNSRVNARCASRTRSDPDIAFPGMGFRVCLDSIFTI
jgi:formylglycine-generating enzyme required for sulfatase activity